METILRRGFESVNGFCVRTASHYRVPDENFVLVALSFLGSFQTDSLDEIVQGLNDGGISTIESRDLFFWDGLVRGKGLQNAGSQRSIDFFIKLQEHQTDLIAVGEKPVAAGMRDLFHQTLGAQLPEVITERSQLVLFRCPPEGLQGLRVQVAGGEGAFGGEVAKAHQGVHEGQLSGLIQIQTWVGQDVGKYWRMGEIW